MKLAFCLFKYFPYGGLQRDFFAILQESLRRGHTLDVYTLKWEGEIPQGVNLHIIQAKGFTNHFRYYDFTRQVGAQLSQQDYDLVIGFNKMPYLSVYYAADPCYEAKVSELKSKWYRLIARYRYFAKLEQSIFAPHSLTEIFLITQAQKAAFSHYYGTQEERFHLLPQWITEDCLRSEDQAEVRRALRAEFHIAEDDYLLLMVGSGFKTKGVDRSLAALQQLPDALKAKIKLFILGQDKAVHFNRLANKLGLAEHVDFLGGRTDIPRFLFAADLLLHPAYVESAGKILIEAMAAGLPQIVTDVCGNAHHVATAKAGQVLASPFSLSAFSQAIVTALSSSEQRQLWGDNGVNYVRQQNFMNMPQLACDFLEALPAQHYTRQLPHFMLTIDPELGHDWCNVAAFDDIMGLEGKIFRELDNRRTLQFDRHDQSYFAKLHFGVGWMEIFKNLIHFRRPVLSAENEWLAIKRLQSLQVNTMEAVAYGKKGKNPATRKSFILTRELKNIINLEEYCRDWLPKANSFRLKKRLVDEVAKLAATLHNHGMNHRDFYACHILLQYDHDPSDIHEDNLRLYIIDLHRVQIRNVVPQRWIIKDIGSLYFSLMDCGMNAKDCLRFIRVYKQTTLHQTLREDWKFWRNIQKRGIGLYYKANKRLPQFVMEKQYGF